MALMPAAVARISIMAVYPPVYIREETASKSGSWVSEKVRRAALTARISGIFGEIGHRGASADLPHRAAHIHGPFAGRFRPPLRRASDSSPSLFAPESTGQPLWETSWLSVQQAHDQNGCLPVSQMSQP